MVFKKTTKKTTSTKKDAIPEISKKLTDEVMQYHNIEEELLKQINSFKDINQNKKMIDINKVYDAWVYVFRNHKKVKEFGVKEYNYKGNKILARIENVNGTNKVLFCQLYPESKFPVQTIDSNKHSIKQDLNKLKQIERLLEQEKYTTESKKRYPFELKDIKKSILQKEVELDSIRYGKDFKYTFDLKPNIETLLYDYEDGIYKLIKYVSEGKIMTQASEVKLIESKRTREDIEKQLPKNNSRDWLKVAKSIVILIFMGILIWGTFSLLAYNEERAYTETKEQLAGLYEEMGSGIKTVNNELLNTPISSVKYDEIMKQNQELIKLLTDGKVIETKVVID